MCSVRDIFLLNYSVAVLELTSSKSSHALCHARTAISCHLSVPHVTLMFCVRSCQQDSSIIVFKTISGELKGIQKIKTKEEGFNTI